MDFFKAGAIDPPRRGRSDWAKNLLFIALQEGLDPVTVKGKRVIPFNIILPVDVIRTLKKLAIKNQRSVEETTAGLILAASLLPVLPVLQELPAEEKQHEALVKPKAIKVKRWTEKSFPSSPESMQEAIDAMRVPGVERVNPAFQQSLKQLAYFSDMDRVSMLEVTVGADVRGPLLASMAAYTASQNRKTVISCASTVTWQVLLSLGEMAEARSVGVGVLLDRTQFVMPEAIKNWLEKKPNEALQQWVEEGGPVINSGGVAAGIHFGQTLNWLLEDALQLANDLPVSQVVLSESDTSSAELAYQAQFDRVGQSSILLCSHHMLVEHIKYCYASTFCVADAEQSKKTLLPLEIDTLVMDEAHLLETSLASDLTHKLHLWGLILATKQVKGRGARKLLWAVRELADYCGYLSLEREQEIFRLDRDKPLFPLIEDVIEKLKDISEKQLAAVGGPERGRLLKATSLLRSVLSGPNWMHIEYSPSGRNPILTIGPNDLSEQLRCFWDNTLSATLVSATLFGIKESNSYGLMRHKLAISDKRLERLDPASPEDLKISPETLEVPMKAIPDDSYAWAKECSNQIERITATAKGGTLVLCTSAVNAQQLGERLIETLGERLVVQTRSNQTDACARRFAEKYQRGIKPVWIGVGKAWGGIELGNYEVQPELDFMLTDLVITRIPMGSNRTFTHERAKRSLGFSVVIQEAVWQLRRAIGLLVQREGTKNKRLWVLDARLDSDVGWCQKVRESVFGQ